MAALSARDGFRYGARLFGYLLATTIVGGGLVAAGAGLAYTLEPAIVPGGAAPDSYAMVAAGGLVAALGAFVLISGLFAITFIVLTDAVRLGIDHSSLGPDELESAADHTTSESDEQRDTTDEQPPEPDERPEPVESTPSEPTDDPLAGGGGSDPFDDPETSDPLGGSSGMRPESTGQTQSDGQDRSPSGQRQAGPTQADDDEAWRREIEAKLEDEDDVRNSPSE